MSLHNGFEQIRMLQKVQDKRDGIQIRPSEKPFVNPFLNIHLQRRLGCPIKLSKMKSR